MAVVSCSYIVARVSENQKGQSEISADAIRLLWRMQETILR